jgi:hypothetical protein
MFSEENVGTGPKTLWCVSEALLLVLFPQVLGIGPKMFSEARKLGTDPNKLPLLLADDVRGLLQVLGTGPKRSVFQKFGTGPKRESACAHGVVSATSASMWSVSRNIGESIHVKYSYGFTIVSNNNELVFLF